MIKVQTILYPTDFSENARFAESYVRELAKRFKAAVILIHVVENPILPAAYDIMIDMATLLDDTKRAAGDRLAAEAKVFADDGIKVTTEIRIGAPFVEIVGLAKEKNADLIVMSTHGYGAVKHLFLGSTAERVVREATCPVLTIRQPQS